MTTVTPADFEQFYHLMEQSFPPSERRSAAGQHALLADPSYRLFLHKDADGALMALLACWDFDSFFFIEHFAVSPACRGGGIGGRLLDELIATVNKPIVLEVEPPEDVLTCRRVGFYQRHGFLFTDYPYIQPPMEPGKPTVPLKLMIAGGEMDETQYETVKSTLYARVYNYSV